ncbi:ATP-binding protein [Seleniivibrio woodruffii]|uniref:ATP-binding protein n=1 Tax=Seleniivibrio woodruffii TaxID=1078050 RepID=UPI002409FD85|nr:ATP-binding protein [Seleniivibrio woodruffii]
MIHRSLTSKISAKLGKGKAVIIYGPRQSGKTTLIRSMLSDMKDRVLYLNGDDMDVRETLSSYSTAKLKALAGTKTTVFIDEAQRIKDIGLIIKILTDNFPEIQVIATGSSAFELKSSIKEPLTGRKYEFNLFPLSFAEMTEHHGLLDETRMTDQRLIYGYYPEIVTKPDERRDNLKMLADSYLYKDILSLENIAKPHLLEKIVKALALQVGSEVSFNELAQLTGTSAPTAEKYVNLLEKAYVVFQLPAFSRNVRNEIKKSRKIFFYDNGIRNAVIGNFLPVESRSDIGALWENYLVSERIKRNHNNTLSSDSYFWRTKQQQEIDYIEECEGQLHAYEFKYGSRKASLPSTFAQAYPGHTFQTVTRENFWEFLA